MKIILYTKTLHCFYRRVYPRDSIFFKKQNLYFFAPEITPSAHTQFHSILYHFDGIVYILLVVYTNMVKKMISENEIPVVIFDPENQFEKMPKRPFILKIGKRSIYYYGNRYNVITSGNKTTLLDMGRANILSPEDEEKEENIMRVFTADITIIRKGTNSLIVLNSGKEFALSDVLITDDDIFPYGTFNEIPYDG